MRKLSEQVESTIACFKGAIGNDDVFTKIVNDTAAMLGRHEVKSVEGEWTTGASFKIKAKDLHTQQLPPNSPNTILLWFGMRLREVGLAGEFVTNASIPKAAQAYVDQCLKVATEVTK